MDIKQQNLVLLPKNQYRLAFSCLLLKKIFLWLFKCFELSFCFSHSFMSLHSEQQLNFLWWKLFSFFKTQSWVCVSVKITCHATHSIKVNLSIDETDEDEIEQKKRQEKKSQKRNFSTRKTPAIKQSKGGAKKQ